jgi:hypothetical protein
LYDHRADAHEALGCLPSPALGSQCEDSHAQALLAFIGYVDGRRHQNTLSVAFVET